MLRLVNLMGADEQKDAPDRAYKLGVSSGAIRPRLCSLLAAEEMQAFRAIQQVSPAAALGGLSLGTWIARSSGQRLIEAPNSGDQ